MLRAIIYLDDVPFVGINHDDPNCANRYSFNWGDGEPRVFESRRNLLSYLDKIFFVIDAQSPGSVGTIRIEIDNREVGS